MKSFFRYFKSFFKYKIFRIIIYLFITFLIFTFFKIKGVNAATISGVNATVYFQTQNCDLNSSDNTNFSCQKGTSYRFRYEVNTTGKDDTFFPFILNNSENYVLFKNMIIQYDFNEPFTIDSTHRSIYMKVGSGTYLETNINEGEKKLNQNWLKTVPINSSNQEDNRLITPANYNFKPYYCTYLDSNDLIHDCGVILNHESATNYNYWFVFDIPLNTNVKQIRLYLGTYLDYSNMPKKTLVGNTAYYVPSNNNFFYNTWVAGQSNINIYGVLYSNYRTHDNIYNTTYNVNNNIGLMWLYKGLTYRNPTFNVPNDTSELNYSSSSYTSNSYKWYFSSYSEDLQNSINNTIPTIDQEIDQQQSEGDFDSLFNGFLNSSEASSFTNLFNALFSYPISKFNESLDEGLFDDTPANNKGTGGLNLALCTGRGFIGDVSEDRLEIPFYAGVKWTIPCFHYDIYSQMHDENTSIYPSSINGISIQSGRGSTTFYTVYRLILRGVLVYLLFINVLDIYKYILDSDRKEIEVIDL